MTWVLLSACGVLFVGLALALLRISEMEREFRAVEKADHAKCMAHVASVTSKRFLSMYLHNLAAKADTTEELGTFARLRFHHRAGGPSVLSLWLTEQAEAVGAVDDGSA